MRKLCLQQADGVTPGRDGTGFYAGFPGYLGDLVRRNKIANLAQDVELGSCWFDEFFLFHACRVAGLNRQANTFFRFPVGWLCKQIWRSYP